MPANDFTARHDKKDTTAMSTTTISPGHKAPPLAAQSNMIIHTAWGAGGVGDTAPKGAFPYQNAQVNSGSSNSSRSVQHSSCKSSQALAEANAEVSAAAHVVAIAAACAAEHNNERNEVTEKA